MCCIVNFAEVLEVEMSINLRCADVGVAKHFLYCAQIATTLQHMAGKAVPKHMRMHMIRQTLFDDPVIDPCLYRACVDTTPLLALRTGEG